MSVPSYADVIVLKHRPGLALRPGDIGRRVVRISKG